MESGRKKTNVLFDASVITNALKKNNGRTGIFFVAYNVLKEMAKCPELNVELYSSDTKTSKTLKKMLEHEAEFKNLNISSIYKRPSRLLVRLEYLKDKKSKITGFFIKTFLSILKLINKFQLGKNLSEKELEKFDAFFSPIFEIPDEIAKSKKIKKCTIIYDVTPIIFPEYFSDVQEGKSWFLDFVKTINKDDYYFSISEHTKQDFIQHVPQIDGNKITTTLLAASDDFYPCYDKEKLKRVRLKYNVLEGKKYLFSLCSLEPRKNLIMAIKAYIKFIEKYNIEDFVYVLGGYAWEGFIEKMEKVIPDFEKYENKIIKAGYVDDEDLAALYSGAEFFVYTSEYEGFGLPPLEAMCCGKAVITSNNSSLPEVVGDAGIMIDFDNLEQHVEAYEKLYFDIELRKEYEQKGLARAKEFSWEKCTDIMVKEMAK